MIKIISISILALLAGFDSCNETDSTAQSQTNEARAAGNADLLDHTWQLMVLDGKPVDSLINEQVPYIRFFSEDSTVSGRLGCNQFGGRFELTEAGDLNMSKMFSTKKFCQNMWAEDTFLPQAESINRFQFSGDTLWLMATDKQVAGWVKQ